MQHGIILRLGDKPRTIHGAEVHLVCKDNFGAYLIVDIGPNQTMTDITDNPFGCLIHTLAGPEATVCWESNTHLPLPWNTFATIPPGKMTLRNTTNSPCRVAIVERYAPPETGTILSPHFLGKIDGIPLSERTPDISLWAGWEQTPLRQDMGYEYFVIGRLPRYERVYIHEAKPHAHPGSDSIVYVQEGHGLCLLGNQTFILSSGDVIVIPDGWIHGFPVGGAFAATSTQWKEPISKNYVYPE